MDAVFIKGPITTGRYCWNSFPRILHILAHAEIIYDICKLIKRDFIFFKNDYKAILQLGLYKNQSLTNLFKGNYTDLCSTLKNLKCLSKKTMFTRLLEDISVLQKLIGLELTNSSINNKRNFHRSVLITMEYEISITEGWHKHCNSTLLKDIQLDFITLKDKAHFCTIISGHEHVSYVSMVTGTGIATAK